MTEKSLDTFFNGLHEDLHDHVTMYAGPDFKQFIEVDIPIIVKKRCKGWVEGHGDALRALIMRLCLPSSRCIQLRAFRGYRLQP